MQVAYAAAYDIIKRIKRFEEYKAMKSHIHLIRHGITEGNLNRWYYGAKDIPLVDQGIAALKASAAEGIYPDLADSDIYTSGMLRCIQTLNAIYGDIEHTIIPELREINCGEFECKSHKELLPDERYVIWCDDKTGDMPMPGGESRNGFLARVHTGFEELFKRHQLKMLSLRHSGREASSIAIIHGGVISAIMFELFGEGDINKFWSWMPDPGRGWSISITDGKATGYERI